MLSILLIAEESAGAQVLRALEATEHRIHAVITGGAAGGLTSVGSLARGLGLDVWPARRMRDPALARDVAAARLDLILNVHSLHIVPAALLAAPTIGAFNLHPGPLPEYAGLNCPSWAIYDGACAYGVTVHRMAAQIDAGPTAYEERFVIGPDETGFSLTARCIRAGVPLVMRLVSAAARDAGAIPAVAQDPTRRRYFGREIPRSGAVVWTDPARRIAALVRACTYTPFPSPWGRPHARIDGRRIDITEVACTGDRTAMPPGTVRVRAPSLVEVATGDEWLALHRVQWEGGAVAAALALSDGAMLADGDAGSVTAGARSCDDSARPRARS